VEQFMMASFGTTTSPPERGADLSSLFAGQLLLSSMMSGLSVIS